APFVQKGNVPQHVSLSAIDDLHSLAMIDQKVRSSVMMPEIISVTHFLARPQKLMVQVRRDIALRTSLEIDVPRFTEPVIPRNANLIAAGGKGGGIQHR